LDEAQSAYLQIIGVRSTLFGSKHKKLKLRGYERFMKFSGYWVSADHTKVTLDRTTFDETDLDPATNWKHAWQNQDTTTSTKGFVELTDALLFAAQ